MNTRLFENSFCRINEVNGEWIRTDKILGTKQAITSYWKNGKLIKK